MNEEEEMGGPSAYSNRRYVRGSANATAMPRHGFHPSQRYRRNIPVMDKKIPSKKDRHSELDSEYQC